MRQLSVSAERSVRGGLRSLRKLVCQLIRLDEVSLVAGVVVRFGGVGEMVRFGGVDVVVKW